MRSLHTQSILQLRGPFKRETLRDGTWLQVTCGRNLSRFLIPAFVLEQRRSVNILNSQHEESCVKVDQRARLSRIWSPTGGIVANADEDAHAKLLRAGFLRQAHSGIFHMLPLGRRVQNKIEKLIDKHMSRLGASRLDLSSISSEELWSKSGRLSAINSELFRFKDRKMGGFLLSPTHQEEITTLVANSVKSYKELPLRLYQISRKYRDELRPRHGLLRSREFIMKDLYTFDCTPQPALQTYQEVREAYVALFDELNVSYLVAEADSGDMGGDLSHEFHFPTTSGEDHVINCNSCGYVANEELATAAPMRDKYNSDDGGWSFIPYSSKESSDKPTFALWRGISKDKSILVNVWYPLSGTSARAVNTHAVKAVVPNLDAGIEHAAAIWSEAFLQQDGASNVKSQETTIAQKVVSLIDYRLPDSVVRQISGVDKSLPVLPSSIASTSAGIQHIVMVHNPGTHEALDLLRIRDGDSCPRCEKGTLKVQTAIELGHTFFLGTRYSDPLEATVSLPDEFLTSDNASAVLKKDGEPTSTSSKVPMQMGCHGIGVSRMIGAVAETLADDKGLNWPRVIAPYEVVIIASKDLESGAAAVYDELCMTESGASHTLVDAILDDRQRSFAWKMNDADLVGYPIIVVVGRGWNEQKCEVQCRRLQIKESVPLSSLSSYVRQLLDQL